MVLLYLSRSRVQVGGHLDCSLCFLYHDPFTDSDQPCRRGPCCASRPKETTGKSLEEPPEIVPQSLLYYRLLVQPGDVVNIKQIQVQPDSHG